jgi:two-component system response regulator LytT
MKATLHVIFWIAILLLLTFVYGPYYHSISESFYFVSMLLPVIIGTCYFFNFYLVPKFLFTKKYAKFILYSVYMLIISLYLEMLVIVLSFIILAHFSYQNMSPVSSDIFILAITLYFIVLLFSFILLVQQSFAKEKAIEALEKEKRKALEKSLTVRSKRQMRSLLFDEILYIESLSDYVKIYLTSKEIVITKEKISRLEERLPEMFVRIHRSFIVNKHKVSSFNKEMVTIGNQPLPLSRTYKNRAWDKLSAKK